MNKSYECNVATHIGPESCGAAREGGVEALTRERAGRVFSRARTILRDADAVGESGRPHRVHLGRSAEPAGGKPAVGAKTIFEYLQRRDAGPFANGAAADRCSDE